MQLCTCVLQWILLYVMWICHHCLGEGRHWAKTQLSFILYTWAQLGRSKNKQFIASCGSSSLPYLGETISLHCSMVKKKKKKKRRKAVTSAKLERSKLSLPAWLMTHRKVRKWIQLSTTHYFSDVILHEVGDSRTDHPHEDYWFLKHVFKLSI